MKWRSLQESGALNDPRSLRDIFAERKDNIARFVPPDVQAIHLGTVAALKAQGLANQVLKIGTKCPEFDLPDHHGKPVSSANLLSKCVVLMFIRGRWCPFCVAQMEAMSLIAAQIEAAGAALVAVSPQNDRQAFFMHNQHRLAFPLLVDAHNNLARQFGLLYRVPEEQQALYSRTFVNLPFTNGDASWELPIPATFVLDGEGTVVFASANEDYMDRPEPLDILSAVQKCGLGNTRSDAADLL
jgi:peroxiredoxin